MSPLKPLVLSKAVALIRAGEVVAFPTETVYGLGASAFNLEGIEKIYRIKGRPSDNPLIVHIASLDHLSQLADAISNDTIVLANAFWPGPLSLILPKKDSVLDRVTGGMSTVALRMPRHPIALELIKECGPLVAPSANKSGRPSPTKAEHVYLDYGDSVPVLDGGQCTVGLESTVLDLSKHPYQILRPGAIGPVEIAEKTGLKVSYASDAERLKHSPGTRYSHYAPNAKVVWWDGHHTLASNEMGLSLEGQDDPPAWITYNGDVQKFASQLFDRFREADQRNCAKIFIKPISGTSALHLALKNRIDKAVGM